MFIDKIFYILCFFPFVKFGKIGLNSDIQPFCLCFSLMILVWFYIKKKLIISRTLYRLICLGTSAIILNSITTLVLALGNPDGLEGCVRNIASFMSLIAISMMSYIVCKYNDGFNEKYVKFIINSYLCVGMVQRFVNSTFLYSFVSNARTSANRGVVSLASEPSFYCYMCIFFLILVMEFKTQRQFYIFNVLFQCIILAKSSVSMVYLFIFVGLYFIFNIKRINMKQVIFIILGISVVFALIYVLFKYNKGQRIVMIINNILGSSNITDMIGKLMDDTSISIRVNDILYGVTGFLSWFGLPHGFHTKIISSGYGSLIYTSGWLGIWLIGYIFYITYRAFRYNSFKWVYSIGLLIIMFSAIQISNPVFCFLIGYFAYKIQTQESIEKSERID